jgi:hypothetical protein
LCWFIGLLANRKPIRPCGRHRSCIVNVELFSVRRRTSERVTAFVNGVISVPIASLTLLLFSLAAAPHPAPRETLRLLLVVDDSAARREVTRGVLLGAEEASHTGALFGAAVELRIREAGDEAAVGRAMADAFDHAAPSIVVAAGDAGLCAALARAAVAADIALLDVGCPAADTPAPANVYAIAALPAPAGDSTRLELWHRSLDRFGGEQLNKRFERRFGSPMTSAAWAGWFAAKVSLDLALHAHAAAGARLLARLRDPAMQFDGQKGRPLHFAAETHRLVQPLYRIAGTGDAEHVVAEVVP